ncbi:UDP-N-acetylmuramate dehydrogenase [Gaopeijia maritima]|uniref:UDP-N-acetylenolpyruvoylglucosamine reductase n=1 Tax=Gaopeijia maritima TaxID=3119007 RepID=A0ABU9EA54_9BACT
MPHELESLARLLPPGRVARDVPLAPLTTFRIGGPADLLVRVTTADEMVAAIEAVRSAGVPWTILGAGANVLVGDGGVRGVVIRSEIDGIEWVDPLTLRAGAGVRTFPDLTDRTVAAGLAGLHHYVGIPSSVGGALWQNLHFLSPDRSRTCFIEEVVVGADVLTAEGERRRVDGAWFEFGYDDSVLHHSPHVVLTADFRLERAPVAELREVVRANLQWRDDRHPDLWLYPSAGSIFKKIEGIGAGRLIDQCGLKGHVHGAAQIFHKHANIIVNLGGATSAEVHALIDLARETVLRETGYELEVEIGLLGDS